MDDQAPPSTTANAPWHDVLPRQQHVDTASLNVLVAADCSLGDDLATTVGALGHRVFTLSEALEQRHQKSIDAVLVALGCDEAWQLIERATGEVSLAPVLVVASANTETAELMRALRHGACGYLLHPIEPVTLDAWLRWAARRAGRSLERSEGGAGGEPSSLSAQAPLVIDLSKRKVWVHGHELTLAPREFELLALLERYRDRVVRREWLLRSLWQVSDPSNTRALDVRISGLRKAIAPHAIADVPRIETVRGSGYRLVL